jgi:hypothetical protein
MYGRAFEYVVTRFVMSELEKLYPGARAKIIDVFNI